MFDRFYIIHQYDKLQKTFTSNQIQPRSFQFLLKLWQIGYSKNKLLTASGVQCSEYDTVSKLSTPQIDFKLVCATLLPRLIWPACHQISATMAKRSLYFSFFSKLATTCFFKITLHSCLIRLGVCSPLPTILISKCLPHQHHHSNRKYYICVGVCVAVGESLFCIPRGHWCILATVNCELQSLWPPSVYSTCFSLDVSSSADTGCLFLYFYVDGIQPHIKTTPKPSCSSHVTPHHLSEGDEGLDEHTFPPVKQ